MTRQRIQLLISVWEGRAAELELRAAATRNGKPDATDPGTCEAFAGIYRLCAIDLQDLLARESG